MTNVAGGLWVADTCPLTCISSFTRLAAHNPLLSQQRSVPQMTQTQIFYNLKRVSVKQKIAHFKNIYELFVQEL